MELIKFYTSINNKILTETINVLKKTYNIDTINLLSLEINDYNDIYKWYDNNIYSVVAFCYNDKIMKKIKSIYTNFIKELKENNKKIPNYDFYLFNIIDLKNEDNIEYIKYKLKNYKFNIVNCKSVIENFFDNPHNLNSLIKLISTVTCHNAFIIGFTINSAMLFKMFMRGNVIKNNIYYIENKVTVEDTYNPYGNKYYFALYNNKKKIKCMGDIEELKRVYKSFNMHFIGSIPFNIWFDKFKTSFQLNK